MTVQYGFSFETESDKESLKKNLSRFFSQPIDLTVTNNTSTYLTATEGKRGVINLRLHKMFLDANADVLRAISGYVQNKNRKASKVLDNYIDAHKHTIIRSQKSTRHFLTEGRWLDLQEMYDTLNRIYFNNRLNLKITWGQAPKKKRRRHIQLGSFSEGEQLITIHPHLDQAFVPKFVVEVVVYHEMCHAVVKTPRGDSGRRLIHTDEFSALEKKYDKYSEAKEWEKKNISKLIKGPSKNYIRSLLRI